KPENIRLDAEGHAVLIDLGFARRASDGDRVVAPRPGRLPYVPPEQARGESGAFASDVFALGVVLYELATGVHPFAPHDERGERPGSSGFGAPGGVRSCRADTH